MKRTHFTVLFLMLCFAGWTSNGQTTSNSLSGTWTTGGSAVKAIKIAFRPIQQDSSYVEFRDYFFAHFTGNEQTYDCWIAQWSFQSYTAQKTIDVSVTWNGVTTEYTFAEFKKYLWP